MSEAAHDASGRLMGLEPAEGLAAMAYVMDAMACHVAPASAANAAAALAALASYAADAARRAAERWVTD